MTRVEDRPTNTLCIWVGNAKVAIFGVFVAPVQLVVNLALWSR